MDRQEKKKIDGGGSENGSDHGGSPDDSDIEDKVSFYVSKVIKKNQIVLPSFYQNNGLNMLCIILYILIYITQKWPIRGIRRTSVSNHNFTVSCADNILSNIQVVNRCLY
jgi:hypothetical protein